MLQRTATRRQPRRGWGFDGVTGGANYRQMAATHRLGGPQPYLRPPERSLPAGARLEMPRAAGRAPDTASIPTRKRCMSKGERRADVPRMGLTRHREQATSASRNRRASSFSLEPKARGSCGLPSRNCNLHGGAQLDSSNRGHRATLHCIHTHAGGRSCARARVAPDRLTGHLLRGSV